MGTKHIHNPGPNVMFVGSKMIPPGEGRDIDESLLPPEHRDVQAAPTDALPNLDALLADALKKTVKELIDGLVDLTHEALERMEALEGAAKKPRASLLQAIAAEKVRRADEAMRLSTLDAHLADVLALPVEEIIGTLENASDEELDRMAVLEVEAEAPRDELLTALAAEKAGRESK